MVNCDFLDTEKNVLYCSIKCATADKKKKDLRTILPKDFDRHKQKGEDWGSLCPICDGEYNGLRYG